MLALPAPPHPALQEFAPSKLHGSVTMGAFVRDLLLEQVRAGRNGAGHACVGVPGVCLGWGRS
jgi:hypothetical protein